MCISNDICAVDLLNDSTTVTFISFYVITEMQQTIVLVLAGIELIFLTNDSMELCWKNRWLSRDVLVIVAQGLHWAKALPASHPPESEQVGVAQGLRRED